MFKRFIFIAIMFLILFPLTINAEDNIYYSCTYNTGHKEEFTLYWRKNAATAEFSNTYYKSMCEPIVAGLTKDDFLNSNCPEVKLAVNASGSGFNASSNTECMGIIKIEKGSGSENGYKPAGTGEAKVDKNRSTRNHSGNTEEVSCDALLPEEVQKIFKDVLNIVKFVGPILVIILTIFDLIKASVSGDPGEMKKVSSKFIKRLVAAILLFFIPILIGIIFDFFDLTAPDCSTIMSIVKLL